MLSSRPDPVALHVQAAKRLLRELDRQAHRAMEALGRETNAEFFAAVEERDRLIHELGAVADTLAHERAWTQGPGARRDGAAAADGASALSVKELAYAAAAALDSHEQLVARTAAEHKRLASVLGRAGQPDAIAAHYSRKTMDGRGSFSVNG